MRIVFDDAQMGQLKHLMTAFVMNRLTAGVLKHISPYDYGMHRVNKQMLKERLSSFLDDYGFEIGKDVHHKNGIGNNSRYPVYYRADHDEKQQVGYVNLNSDLYSSIYMYLTDYNDEKVGRTCVVSPNSATIK